MTFRLTKKDYILHKLSLKEKKTVRCSRWSAYDQHIVQLPQKEEPSGEFALSVLSKRNSTAKLWEHQWISIATNYLYIKWNYVVRRTVIV